MRILCTSDLHGYIPPDKHLPDADLLIIAGDICPNFSNNRDMNRELAGQRNWLDKIFRTFLEKMDRRGTQVVGVAGNHDWISQLAPHLIPNDLPWTYLEDSGTIINGVKVWGSPWQPVYGMWAWNLEEEYLARKWSLIPDDVEILITHGPPRGYGDYSIYSKENVGSYTLMNRIDQLKSLRAHIFGHIHVGYSVEKFGETIMANVSYCNEQYEPQNPPVLIEI